MHSVGRSSEPGDPVRGSVPQPDPVVVAPQVGNRALAQMAARAQPAVAPVAIAGPASASLSLHDPRERLEGAVARAERRPNDLLDILADRTGRNP